MTIHRGVRQIGLTSHAQGKRHLSTNRIKKVFLNRCRKLLNWIKANPVKNLSSQLSYWLMLRVAWLDLHCDFSRGQSESKLLNFVTSYLLSGPLGLARLIKMPTGIRNGLPGILLWFYKEGRAVACTAKLHKAEHLVRCIELHVLLPQGQMVMWLDC